jgi:hypothetical protein
LAKDFARTSKDLEEQQAFQKFGICPKSVAIFWGKTVPLYLPWNFKENKSHFLWKSKVSNLDAFVCQLRQERCWAQERGVCRGLSSLGRAEELFLTEIHCGYLAIASIFGPTFKHPDPPGGSPRSNEYAEIVFEAEAHMQRQGVWVDSFVRIVKRKISSIWRISGRNTGQFFVKLFAKVSARPRQKKTYK